ncbi:MAG: hypothetical protein KJ687_11560 [Proteobacteria bacterium]|nr:hypothetical protein [Pseudomonadota bacterium]
MHIFGYPIREIIFDKKVLDLTSMLLSGAGIFSVLSQFYIPKEPKELNMSFWGSNPHAIKYGHQLGVKKLIDNIFLFMAALGLLIQVPSIIYSSKISQTTLTAGEYWFIFCILLLLIIFVVVLISFFAKKRAKKRWLPEIIESQRAAFVQAQDILNNNGWRTDQLATKDSIKDPEKYTSINCKTVKEHLSQIENLLEVKFEAKDLKLRIQNLEHYFK